MSENNNGALTAEAVLARLKTVVEQNLELKPEQLGALRFDTPIVEGLQLDSLAQVTLITSVEGEFGIEFELEDRQRLTTIRDLVQLIQERAAGNPR